MNCTKCEVSAYCKNAAMMGNGKRTARIMFVSDNPSDVEDRKGKWMEGKGGMLLIDLLESMGIDTDNDCYFTGAIKCATPKDEKGNQRQPLRDEILNCKEYLDAEIAIVDPDIIVPMGNVALKSILGKTGITKYRGKAVEVSEKTEELSAEETESKSRIIFPILHPNAVFKQPKYAKNFTTDLTNLQLLVTEGMEFLESSEVDYRYLEKEEEVMEELDRLEEEAEMLVFDLETTGLNPYLVGSKIICISLTDKTHYGVTIPLEHKAFVWPKEVLARIIARLKKLMENSRIQKMGHNGKFDMKWLLYKYGINVANYAFDPMIAHYIGISEERGGHGLKELAWEHTDMGGYDNKLDEYKKENGIVGNYEDIAWEILREYAAADVDCTMRLYKKFKPIIDSHEKWPELFDMYMEASYALRDMENDGIKLDEERLKEFDYAYQKRIKEIEEKLRTFPEVVQIEREKQKMFERRQLEMKKPKEERDPEILKWNKYKNFTFSFGSTNNLRELLFDRLGLDTPFKTPKGELSTGKETLAYLEDKHPLPRLLSEWRKLDKLYGTYIQPAYGWIGEDNLVHPTFNLTGCTTGDTLILTNKGEVPISQLADYDLTKPGTFFDLLDQELEVFDGEVYRKPLKAFYNGCKEVVTITTKEENKTITCTLNHRLGGVNGWLWAGEIKEGDILVVYDDNGVPLYDYVDTVVKGEAETFDLTMDEYDAELFASMKITFNDGSVL